MNKKQKRIKRLLGHQHGQWNYIESKVIYITPHFVSHQMCKQANQHYPEAKYLWDMFGGIGTDAIHLSTYFSKVVVSELDFDTYQCLTKNVERFNKKNIKTVFTDCHHLLQHFSTGFGLDHYFNSAYSITDPKEDGPIGPSGPTPDLVYFDPPWGKDYIPNQQFDFNQVYLTPKLRVVDLLRQVDKELCQNIIIKSPIRCDTFEQMFPGRTKVLIYPDYKLKFVLVYKTTNAFATPTSP